MDFSVVMSVYSKDNPSYFKNALESVTVAQTLLPKQVVIVQDGPLAVEFGDIIKTVKERVSGITFTVIKKDKNAGLAAALNTGIEVCACEWIARMDSDDISVPERFEKQLAYIKLHPEIDVLGGTISEFITSPGDIVSKRHVCTTHSGIMKMAKSRTPMNHVSVMYRKKAVVDVGMYSENFGKLEDYKLWVDMLAAGKIFANIDDILVYVRIGNSFIERRSNKREIADWDMLQKYLLNGNMISRCQALANRVYIRMFTYMPSWMKKIAYATFLRKKS